MNVNQKGAVGLIEVIRDLTKKGFESFTPIHDYSAVDLITMNSRFETFKLQVKYRETFRGSIEIPFKTVVNGKSIPIEFDAIDGWAVYCPEVDSVVYINKNDVDLTKKAFGFRLTEGSNSVNKNKTRRKLYTEYSSIVSWKK